MKDKRIAYYRGEFRLCEWPSEPTTHRWSPDDSDDAEYAKAVTSAMENGIAFADQEGVKQFIFKTTNEIRGTMLIWQPKEGDNWPAPEGAEIEYQYEENDKIGWNPITKANFEFLYQFKPSRNDIRKVAVLRSESVEKKETGVEELKGNAIFLHGYYTKNELMEILYDLNKSIADRLNQSTPKE